MLARDVIQAVAHYMHDAQLHHRLGEDGLDGIGETFEPIDASDEDVLDASVAQLGDDLQPKLSPSV